MGRNKFIWVIAVILLIIIAYGIYLITAQNKTSTVITQVPTRSPLRSVTPSVIISPSISASPSSQATSSAPEMTPLQVVQEFYSNYEDCLKNPPPPATNQVSIYCQSHNPFITAAFATNLEAGGIARKGADPVVCAQNLPQSISVGTITTDGNTAKGKVIETFGTNTIQPSVSLIKEAAGWKVDNITCPAP